MRIRSFAWAAFLFAGAFAAPVRAQHDSSAADAAALQAPLDFGLRVVESLRAAGLQRPTGRLLLVVDSGGANPRVSFQFTNVPESLHGVVLPLVDAYVSARVTAPPAHLSILLEGMAPLPPPDTGPVRSEQVPEFANSAAFSAQVANVVRTHPAAAAGGPVDVHAAIHAYVDPRGVVVLVEARPTGDAHVDTHLTAVGHTMRFRPARVNRRPVGVWIDMPLRFSSPD